MQTGGQEVIDVQKHISFILLLMNQRRSQGSNLREKAPFGSPTLRSFDTLRACSPLLLPSTTPIRCPTPIPPYLPPTPPTKLRSAIRWVSTLGSACS